MREDDKECFDSEKLADQLIELSMKVRNGKVLGYFCAYLLPDMEFTEHIGIPCKDKMRFVGLAEVMKQEIMSAVPLACMCGECE